ncbi:conjugal transfer protein [Lacticaseibacillus paracasei]|uniref:conjugal transfer protein n=1 Tax=Lacticaseibacillus paracasei TaxID=1597 RepID=UPI000975C7A9|nr:conjugal transfer protein [Lacticaseibacillus paracasei]MDK6822709.1 conjugal transfer protein [Lacticaseibacillus paracasei]MDK7799869.1 conjugal transfer protein [Lacticaseibacillus paracasei]UYX00297.1 conjugal transfer protein [Lacticaseibacillus paracasei subsp. tolerans]UYX03286.1 conjugal transfer protein [Lacticaseibacillus paracasei subsp. tolerans]
MKKVRSYTSIWSVEKVLYAINDLQLPFPITFTQMTWFIVSLFAVMLLGDLPPLSSIDGAFLKYVGIPAGLTWFMSQKTFDNKKPMGFLRSVINYAITPKLTYAGQPVKSQKEKQTAAVTYVWRYHNEISD